MTSAEMRRNPLFLRNEFEPYGAWGIPLIKKQNIDLENIKLIACSNTKKNDTTIKKRCGVHFFVDDYRFMCERINPRAIICLGEPFAEMSGNIIKVAYRASKKKAVS